jgi:hypothetical protein
MSGSLPDPNAKRRNARVGPVIIRADEKASQTPDWPIGKATKAEVEHWRTLWSLPQSVMWERQGMTSEVARYCRLYVMASTSYATAAIHGQATALGDRIGMSPRSLRALMWSIVPADDERGAPLVGCSDEVPDIAVAREARRRRVPAVG